jgi:hypothetical protein
MTQAAVHSALSYRTCYLVRPEETRQGGVYTVALCRYTFEEAETTFVTQTLSASWESFTDPESPIKGYEVIILEEVGLDDVAYTSLAGDNTVDPVSPALVAGCHLSTVNRANLTRLATLCMWLHEHAC